MRLPQPEGVETQVFSHLCELKPFLERVELRCTFTCDKHSEKAEVHRYLLFSLIPHCLSTMRSKYVAGFILGLCPWQAKGVPRQTGGVISRAQHLGRLEHRQSHLAF